MAAVVQSESILSAGAGHVSELGSAVIGNFLSQVADGLAHYESLHNLTQQVEHEYQGRFVIELIQNAHDALYENITGDRGRIELLFDPNDSEHGALLIANDGNPFSSSNFERLAQLGRSDKDPRTSIGNKGIGFRSVLEISESPEIYSRAVVFSSSYDGYCFSFSPNNVEALVPPILELAYGESVPESPFVKAPLVDWSDSQISKFRKRAQKAGRDWLLSQIQYLSPYSLPVPIESVKSANIATFEASGFSTVVRLPLKSSAAREKVMKHVGELRTTAVLFLDKVKTLTLQGPDGPRVVIHRSLLPHTRDGSRLVQIGVEGAKDASYAVWTRNVQVDAAPQTFQDSVAALPGRWKTISDVPVSLAVRLEDEPERGMFSIYLPTDMPTGCAAHINAPFFGEMNRKKINFDGGYNGYLLDCAADLALDIVRTQLAGKGAAEAQAIVDILAPLKDDPYGSLWIDQIDEAETRASASLRAEPLTLVQDECWCALSATSFVRRYDNNTVLTEDWLREHAAFSIFHPCLLGRTKQLEALAAHFFECGVYPSAEQLSDTIEACAAELLNVQTDWNSFWKDVRHILPTGQDVLAGRAVILGVDGKLHRATDGSTVFFLPRQGSGDDDVGNAAEVPPTLQPHVAFLSESIRAYDSERPSARTPTRIYLENGLVSPFRVESIFVDVLHALTPQLPVALGEPGHELCRDIMQWALRLIANVKSRNRCSDETYRLLAKIPVPCMGGWYPLAETTFGEGWLGSLGGQVNAYLNSLASPLANESKRRLLLPPSHAAWGTIGLEYSQILFAGGVFDGLRLHSVQPSQWPSGFNASRTTFSLERLAPPHIGELWQTYSRRAVSEREIPLLSPKPFFFGAYSVFPGLDVFDSLPSDVKELLSTLILHSMPAWGDSYLQVFIDQKGGSATRVVVSSPMKHFLQSSRWLGVRDGDTLSWAAPSERWHVPAHVLSVRGRNFSHLRPLPTAMAALLDNRQNIAERMRALGMPMFDVLTETDNPILLRQLIGAIGSPDAPDSNVLLGQIRDAWRVFRPHVKQPPLGVLPVRRAKQLAVLVPTVESPAYLPDYGAYVNELASYGVPILAMQIADARDLKEWFTSAYVGAVKCTSDLAIWPMTRGEKWSPTAAFLLADSELGWIITPLLVLVAFHGQIRGVHSPAFETRAEALREMRIHWVSEPSIAIVEGDRTLLRANVRAHWDAATKTIIADDRCRNQPDALSVTFAQALQRDDLELPLRFILNSLSSVEAHPESIADFLAPLHISPEQVDEVVQHVRGDFAHVLRLCQALAACLDPTRIFNSSDVTSAPDLRNLLMGFGLSDGVAMRALSIAQSSHDMFEFGRSMYRELGEIAALPAWNRGLASLGLSDISNRAASSQLEAGLEEAAGIVKKVIAFICSRSEKGAFASRWKAYNDSSARADLSRLHWDVDFPVVMAFISEHLEWTNHPSLCVAFRDAHSVEHLRARLEALGPLLSFDPDECARSNHALFEKTAKQIEKLRLAWCMKSTTNNWQDESHRYVEALNEAVADIFCQAYIEHDAFVILSDRNGLFEPVDFALEMSTARDVNSLQKALGLSEQDIDSAEEKFAELKMRLARRRNFVPVCGLEFDASEENLGALWNFLGQHIDDSYIDRTTPLDLRKTVDLDRLNKKPRGSTGRPRTAAQKPKRQSKAMEQLIGLAGEMFAFRLLQRKYGSDVVGAANWYSENSRYVYPTNEGGRDGAGYDFGFAYGRVKFMVEVKATIGSDESFTLGSSEIRRAREAAETGRQKERFVIVHVRDALSKSPTAVVLPNPYDSRYKDVFSLEEADARVRYKLLR